MLVSCSSTIDVFTMFISPAGHICVFVLLISGVPADWEILNESTDPATHDLSLQDDHLLPALQPGRTKDRITASQGQAGSKHVYQAPYLHLQENKTAAPERIEPETYPSLKRLALQDSSVSGSRLSDNTVDNKREDDIDLADEGLLLVDSERGQPVHGQKQGIAEMSLVQPARPPRSDIVSGVQKSKSSLQEKMSEFPVNEVAADKMASTSLKVACIQESSWECQMFKQHFLAMQGHIKLSHRASVYERSKRQASSNYKNVLVDASNWNSRNLLGCEDGDCFSGDGYDPDTNLVAPHFTFQSSTTAPTGSNLTKLTLTKDKKKDLANRLEEKLKDIFSKIPGFKCVKVDYKNIYIDPTGVLYLKDWEVTIDGGNESYTGSTADDVARQVDAALKDADVQYKNIEIDGQRPANDFNVTKAVEDVKQEANKPCAIYPSPCPCGYGRCEQPNPNPANSIGIRLRCTDNCLNYSDCSNHGQCRKDIAGNAYCNCTGSWIGPYCDKQNTTISDRDNTMSPVYTISQKSEFNTSLTDKDLTPEKKKEIAKNLTEEIKNTFASFPGIKDIIINPDNISIVGGVLVVPWNLTIDSGNPAYTGKTVEEIKDVVRDKIQDIGDSYRNNVTVDGQHPINDLDFVDATEQVEKQARDPCSTNSCPVGYQMCEAVGATKIKCLHKCNSRPSECQNGGQCQLDSAGNAVCQCNDDYTGSDCESQDSSLDAGQIAGVVAGSALLVGAAAGTAAMMAMGARRKKVEYTDYRDVDQVSDQPSNPSNMVYLIDRPGISKNPMPIYGQSAGSNSGNFSTPSSYATPDSPGRDNIPAGTVNSQA